jgi:Ribbon-helix-helix protein, copG family
LKLPVRDTPELVVITGITSYIIRMSEVSEPELVTVTVEVPRPLVARMDELRDDDFSSRSVVVRRLLKKALAEETAAQPLRQPAEVS